NFLQLPRSVIDLGIDDRSQSLYNSFQEYPRLDISKLKSQEKKEVASLHLANAFFGINTGNNFAFVKYWFEVHPQQIRTAELIEDVSEIGFEKQKPFVPFSKGGGDIQYYLNNVFIIDWTRNSIDDMKKYNGARLLNIGLLGKSQLHWSRISTRSRGRFCISQSNFINDGNSPGIVIIDNDLLSIFSLLCYLNSKIVTFLVHLQTKDRMWQVGNIARVPIPLDFLKEKEDELAALGKESFELRQEWDTGNAYSPVYSESLMDKVISPNSTISNQGMPKTSHPFCNDFNLCMSRVAKKLRSLTIYPKTATLAELLDCLEKRFQLLTNRLYQIDNEIDMILYKLLDDETRNTLDKYTQSVIGKTSFFPERDIWFKDFLMANLIEVIKTTASGIISLDRYRENSEGLYERIINHFCLKFQRDLTTIQPLLKELEGLLGKDFKRWIVEDFFFYHCQRFGGRPIIWQFSSRNKSKMAAMDIFIDYHKLNENTLATIRIDYVQPLLKSLEQRKETGLLSDGDSYKLGEIEAFLKACLSIEQGYMEIPSPNMLTGNKAQSGKGDDKTYDWVFKESAKIIQKGYKPDLFKGVLVNIIPLCLEVADSKKNSLTINYQYLCPKGTLKYVLKKIGALDQLKQRPVQSNDQDYETDDEE
ncbi:MAG: hypothetical protein ACFFD4_30940, partial [Candidatus Odinarchaeota archaeon]